MRPDQIRDGAYYQGADGSVRLAVSRNPRLVYQWDLSCRDRTDVLVSEFASWAVAEVRPEWRVVESEVAGRPVSRQEALAISTQVLHDAEAQRLAMVEREAREGATDE